MESVELVGEKNLLFYVEMMVSGVIKQSTMHL
jgi:hypothetical protein